ncbi:MAG: VOC family protein [Myxococcota bacterium]
MKGIRPMEEVDAPKLSWGHVNLNVRDLETSVVFYQKLGFEVLIPSIPYLGMERAGEPTTMPSDCAEALGVEPSARGRACIMGLGGKFPMLDLTEFQPGDTPPSSPAQDPQDEAPGGLGFVRLCLASQEIAADHAQLSAKGVPFSTLPCAAKDGMATIAVCSDPDGNRIELIQLHPERWPAA